MPLQLDVFLLILRLLLIVLLYLFLMQVVIAITRDLKKTAAVSVDTNRTPPVVGHLVVVDSGPSNSLLPGTRFDLAPRTYIGRAPTSTIQLMDNFISSEQTYIENRHGTWYVQDANSKYGTFVNDQPASQALPARPGAIVKIGFISFKLAQ